MFTQSNARRLATVILFSVFFLAISMVSAMNRTCSISTVDANSPEWLAVRQQYEPGYLPPQSDDTTSQTVDANSGIWLATRQQYEPGYQPPRIADANSPEWLAVRQQYETSYLPPGDIHTEDNSTGECETLS